MKKAAEDALEKAEAEKKAAEEEAARQKQIADEAKATKVYLYHTLYLIYTILCISSIPYSVSHLYHTP